MTPRLGDTVSCPETIEEMTSQQSLEAPVSPDDTKGVPAWPELTTGYVRVNTEEDNIPRITTCPDINDKSKETRYDSFDQQVTNYLDLALGEKGSKVTIFTAQTNPSHKQARNDRKADNTDKIGEGVKDPIVTDPISQIHFKDKGNGIVQKTDCFASHSFANTQAAADFNSSANNYVPHPVANTQPTPANSSTNGYIPHPPANTQPTPVNSSTNGYVPHPPANTQPTSANSRTNGYISHPPPNTQPTPANPSTNGYVPHPPANTQHIPVNSGADGYVSH